MSSNNAKGRLRFYQLIVLAACFLVWYVLTSPTLLPPIYFDNADKAAFFFGEVGAQKHVAPHADEFNAAVGEQAPKPGRAMNGVVDFLLEKRSDDDAARI